MNRHNVGFRVVDAIAARCSVSFRKPLFGTFQDCNANCEGGRLFLAKPLTYMNRSGDAIAPILQKSRLGIEQLLIVCDSIDLSPGVCRLKMRGGSGGHNGLKSVIQALGSEDFMRLCIGVGRPLSKEDVVRFVLEDPSDDEADLIQQGIDRAALGIIRLLTEPAEKVMHELNRKDPH